MQDDPIKSPLPPAAVPHPAATILPLPTHPAAEAEAASPLGDTASPAWADDLRKLYNAVVEEPLPDSLIDLLSQLDAED